MTVPRRRLVVRRAVFAATVGLLFGNAAVAAALGANALSFGVAVVGGLLLGWWLGG